MTPPPGPRFTRDPAELDRIADMLRARIGDLVYGVWHLREGWREGHDWVCRNPLRADHDAKSFRISLSGPYQGMVKDFAGPFGRCGRDTMSPLSFHAEICHGGDMGAAVRWAKAWLGLDGTNPDALRVTHRAILAFDDRPESDPEEIARKRKRAKAIYLGAQPSVIGTPVETYLRGRGIDLARLFFPVRSLRFVADLFNKESGRKWPAMVAPIVAMNGDFLGIHRTWLEIGAGGRVAKAPLKEAKLSYGPYKGGVIRIWNGTRIDPDTGEVLYGRSLREQKEPCDVDVAEGIEDALSVVIACPDARVMAGVSLSNMVGLAFPPVVAGVNFWRQNDKADSAAARQFVRVADNQVRQGKTVRVVSIPGEWKDPNEVLQSDDGATTPASKGDR